MRPDRAWADPELSRVGSRVRVAHALELLSATGGDLEQRVLRMDRLSELLAPRLEEVEEVAGDDPDALTLLGAARVHRAWKIRGASLARYVSRERFDGFFTELACAEAPL